MNEEEKKSIEEFRKQLRLAINVKVLKSDRKNVKGRKNDK